MKNYKNIIGIDVSKLKLDVSLVNESEAKQLTHFIVSNDQKGIKQIAKEIKLLKVDVADCLFCFENTGVYSMPLTYFFSKWGFDYCVIPALEIKRSKGISRGKTDKTDAKDIAFYALTHMYKLRLSSIPEEDIAKLRLLFTERDKLVKAIKLFETTSENESFIPKEITKGVVASNKRTVAFLKKSLKEIELKIKGIINQNQRLKQQFDLACSVPGVGQQTATYLIITTKAFTAFSNWRKLACYSGIAPFEYSSGSSVRARTKVHNMADKKLKSMLNMCALNSKKFDQEIAEYYARKTAEGKNPMLVMNAVRCKVLSRVFATISRGTPYVNLKKHLN